ncbi:hypothetical protein [Luteimonas terrae]|uniref:TonB C-terminal domain-containing protein n=1 Tax=Luteimonas terrae TaxID=1530191 RepID=A0ABU1XY57_9GAMM|nr:hypothetical protein [Luteimonas terrae]MDR7193702.1 hypothetical protein [Luteimonas terrae]
MRRVFAISLMAVFTSASSMIAKATSLDESVQIEFLWAPTPADALARQPTRGFLLDGQHAHQICVVAIRAPHAYRELRIDVADADGRQVGSQQHDDFRSDKRCYPVALDPRGAPGSWTFTVFLDGAQRETGSIEVARRLEEAAFYRPSGIPYVLGRPNYDASIPPDAFIGRLVWIMDVDTDGRVTDVKVENAEGVGERMRHRAIAAGWLSLFPPDPARAAEPLRYRRELTFATD